MILFLDVISPEPKFVVIDNNKTIESLHILDGNYKKISDRIHIKFLSLQKKYSLINLLNYLIVCTGPGSYTSLRVGISFMLGISYSKKIPICGFSGTKLLGSSILIKDFYKTLIVICSTNNQNYICLPINHKKFQYKILNVIHQDSLDNIDFKLYSKCITNFNLPDFLNNKLSYNIIKLEYANFEDKLNNNLLTTSVDENILQPIYVSNNELFNY